MNDDKKCPFLSVWSGDEAYEASNMHVNSLVLWHFMIQWDELDGKFGAQRSLPRV